METTKFRQGNLKMGKIVRMFNLGVTLPELSLKELKSEAIDLYNDRGQYWKLHGCDTFASDNKYTKAEVAEYSAPEWQPAMFNSDHVLINRICVNHLLHRFTFNEDGFVVLARKIGVIKTLDVIGMVAATKICERYPTLKSSNPSKVKDGLHESIN